MPTKTATPASQEALDNLAAGIPASQRTLAADLLERASGYPHASEGERRALGRVIRSLRGETVSVAGPRGGAPAAPGPP